MYSKNTLLGWSLVIPHPTPDLPSKQQHTLSGNPYPSITQLFLDY